MEYTKRCLNGSTARGQPHHCAIGESARVDAAREHGEGLRRREGAKRCHLIFSRRHGGYMVVLKMSLSPSPARERSPPAHLARKLQIWPKVACWPNILTENLDYRPQVGPTFGPTM